MKPRYIVAVSGGVDSIVLLDQLVRAGEAELVVAHVDHGIRQESGEDAQFVAGLAEQYGLRCESTTLQLGLGASEEQAREGRWRFLRDTKEKYTADTIVTAHHADDVVETMIINLMRGTGWRGIATLRETGEIKRPLLGLRKKDIIRYAKDRGLSWHEDATNQDDTYLRNRVRRTIIPHCSDQQFAEFIALHRQQLLVREEIERKVSALSPAPHRYEFIMWPDSVAREILRALVGSLPRRELDRGLLFIRTARSSKQLQLSNGKKLRVDVKQFIVLEAED